jgi:hypothetical protein
MTPLVGPLAHQVEGPPGDAQPAHAVVDAARAQPLLGDGDAGTLLAEEVGLRHPARLVDDLGVASTSSAASA